MNEGIDALVYGIHASLAIQIGPEREVPLW